MGVYIYPIGDIDESADVAKLFDDDVRGRFGYYYGQLVCELQEKLPALSPKIGEVLRRELLSPDGNRRTFAREGLDKFRGPLELEEELLLVAARYPQDATSSTFLSLVGNQRPTERMRELVVRLGDLPLDAEAKAELARAIIKLLPEQYVSAFGRAVNGRDDVLASALLRSQSSSEIEHALAWARDQDPETRASVVRISYEGLFANSTPSRYDRWVELAKELGVTLTDPPPRPDDSEQQARFAALQAEREAREQQLAAMPAAVVLTAGVWVDLVRSPEGPPAELFSLLRQHGVGVLASAALIEEVRSRLVTLGWSAEQAAQAAQRVGESTTLVAESSPAEIALAHGLTEVFTVGPTESEPGVSVLPVHALLTRLRQ